MSEKAKKYSAQERHDYGSSVTDLVRVGKNGNTFHRPDGSGKMLSTHELALLDEHSDLIRSTSPSTVANLETAEPIERFTLEEARQRVQEEDAYQSHLEALSKDSRDSFDRGLDRLDSGNNLDAESRDQQVNQELVHQALETAYASSAKLRRMRMMADSLAAFRNENGDSERIKEKEDKLEELIDDFVSNPDLPEDQRIVSDQAIDDIINRTVVTSEVIPVNERPEEVAEEAASTADDEPEVVTADEADEPEVPAAAEAADAVEDVEEDEVVEGEIVPDEPEVPPHVEAEDVEDVEVVETVATDEEVPPHVEVENERVSRRTSLGDIFRHPGAYLGSRLVVARSWWEHRTPEQKRDMKIGGAILGAVAVVGVLLGAKYGLDHSELTRHVGTAGGGSNEFGIDFDKASKEALKVRRGEGFYQTFKELGIPKSKWHETLMEYGPKFVKKGLAYRDSGIGGFGWSRPMKLTPDQLEGIFNK